MKTEIQDSNIEILKGRIIRGIEYCNSVWQQSKTIEDQQQYEKISDLLASSMIRLDNLIYAYHSMGYSDCVFGQCKFDENNFFCFKCSKLEA